LKQTPHNKHRSTACKNNQLDKTRHSRGKQNQPYSDRDGRYELIRRDRLGGVTPDTGEALLKQAESRSSWDGKSWAAVLHDTAHEARTKPSQTGNSKPSHTRGRGVVLVQPGSWLTSCPVAKFKPTHSLGHSQDPAKATRRPPSTCRLHVLTA